MRLIRFFPCSVVFLSVCGCFASRQLKNSQLGQDAWILSIFNRPRFYLDVGCNDGEAQSNSQALDERGWQGICVDPYPKNFEKRTCKLYRHPVAATKENVTFISADTHGGIEKHVGFNKDLVKDSPRVVLETRLLHELLDESNAPPFIDYFSLDTEGSEREILESFPFWKYKFGAITVEHNFEEPKRSEIRAILRRNGYRLYRQVKVDDWFMNDDYMPALPLAHKPIKALSEVLES